MTLSNADMIEAFLNGAESGSASRMEIVMVDGVRCIVGYGWAVYAADFGDEVALYGDGYATDDTNVGWAGYSGTTTGHIQQIKAGLEATGRPFQVVDHQLTRKQLRRADPTGRPHDPEDEVDALDYTGHHYQKPA